MLKNTSWSHIRRLAVLIGASALTFTVVAVAPAQASVAQGGVYGTGSINDDWGDEGPLSTTQNSHNGAVLLWQSVLIADGYLSSSDGDCYFGPTTAAATKKWQADRGLTADGIVGPATFGHADDNLLSSGSTITYYGAKSKATPFYRTSSGRWYTTSNTGAAYYFDYTNATICSIL